MIFPPIELPQYIVVPPTDCEMKDIIGYHNKHLTGKISNYTAFFEKCGYLLSAIYLQSWNAGIFMISIWNLTFSMSYDNGKKANIGSPTISRQI